MLSKVSKIDLHARERRIVFFFYLYPKNWKVSTTFFCFHSLTNAIWRDHWKKQISWNRLWGGVGEGRNLKASSLGSCYWQKLIIDVRFTENCSNSRQNLQGGVISYQTQVNTVWLMNIVGLILCFEPISLCISTTNTVYCLQIQIYRYIDGRPIKKICKTILSLQAQLGF